MWPVAVQHFYCRVTKKRWLWAAMFFSENMKYIVRYPERITDSHTSHRFYISANSDIFFSSSTGGFRSPPAAANRVELSQKFFGPKKKLISCWLLRLAGRCSFGFQLADAFVYNLWAGFIWERRGDERPALSCPSLRPVRVIERVIRHSGER